MAWKIFFYEKPNGKSPVEELLDSLPKAAKAKCISYIELFITEGFKLSANYLEKVEDNLWALRPESSNKEYRLFFCRTEDETIVFLHAVHKKTRRLRPNDIEIARRRRDEITS